MRGCGHLSVQSQCGCMDSRTNQPHLHHPYWSGDGDGGNGCTVTAQNGTRGAGQAGMGLLPLIGNTLTPGQVQFGAELKGIGDGAWTDPLQLTVQEILHELVGRVGKQGLPASGGMGRDTSADAGWDGQVPILAAQDLDIDHVVTFEDAQLNGQAGGTPEVEHCRQGQVPKILGLLGQLPQFKTPDADLVPGRSPGDEIVPGEFCEYPGRGGPGKACPARDFPSPQDRFFWGKHPEDQ